MDWFVIVLVHQVDFSKPLKDCPEIVSIQVALVIVGSAALDFEDGVELVELLFVKFVHDGLYEQLIGHALSNFGAIGFGLLE